jgi:hypothetical protein
MSRFPVEHCAHLPEHEFITATKIRLCSDIAVMAQFQRNAGIGVTLGASECLGASPITKDVTMKTTKILSAVSAAALLGISSIALAQAPSGASGAAGSSGAPAGNTMQRDTPAANPGSTSKELSKDSLSKDSVSKEGQKSNQAQQGKEMGKDGQKSQAQSPAPADSKSQMSQDKDAKSGATVGAAPAGAVNLTTEQRTTIRQTVLTSNAPRATNVNFAINVGVVVPSSVRVVEVPDTIVRIRPAWKGYRYFVYNDEIIIVEPRTLKIVAVLDV